MSIVKNDIVSQFGSYYLNSGQNLERLKSAIRHKAVTPSYAKSLIVDSDVYQMSNVVLGEIVQQFQKTFTPKGDVTFKPNEIRLRNAKVDISLYPDDVKASWLGFLASIDEQERKNWPSVRFLLESEIVPQIPHDMETKAYFKGSYVAPTAGTPGTTAGTMDGIKKLLDAGITANTMNAVTLSAAPSASNIFEMVEEFADSFNSALSGTKMRIYMAPSWLRAYFRDKRNTHGTDVNYKSEVNEVDFMQNVELVGLPSMEGENYIWATPVDNFLHLRKVNGMKEPLIEESKREVFFLLDWYEGIGFGYDQLVYVYKPA